MIDLPTASLAARSNARVSGAGPRTLLLAHGFCSNRQVYARQVTHFSRSHRTVTYDLAGFGEADPDLWDPRRYVTLEGYAHDIVQLIDELDLCRVTFVGGSLSAMTGLLASLARPERFDALVFVGGSPRYLNGQHYRGGFEREAVERFYALLDGDEGWTDAVTSLLLNGPLPLALLDIAQTVRGVRPEVARTVARAIFGSDYRHLLERALHPVLIVQTASDAAVPEAVGKYMAALLPDAELAVLPGVGHLPMRTQPELFNRTVEDFLRRRGVWPG